MTAAADRMGTVTEARLVTVGVSDMKVSDNQGDTLITYSLGSCLGLSLYDPRTRTGGLLHSMLPFSKIAPEKCRENPFMFTDAGVQAFLQELFDRGAKRGNLVAKVAGCAQLQDEKGFFRIGERNYAVLRKVLWKNDILIAAEDIGGSISRTVSLEISTGRTRIRSGTVRREL